MTLTYPTSTPIPTDANPLIRATLALERTPALDVLAGVYGKVAEVVVRSPARRDLLQGRWLGHAVHPLLVTVPLGTWTSVTVLDLVGGEAARPVARTLTGLGVLAALPSALTGLAELADTNQRDRRTASVHAVANAVGVVLYVQSWRARRKGDHRKGARLSAAGMAAVGAGGYLGGHLTQVRKVGSHHPAYAGT